MAITISRIDNDKELFLEVSRIEVVIDGAKYTLTDRFGALHIHAHEDSLTVQPGCANEISVTAKTK